MRNIQPDSSSYIRTYIHTLLDVYLHSGPARILWIGLYGRIFCFRIAVSNSSKGLMVSKNKTNIFKPSSRPSYKLDASRLTCHKGKGVFFQTWTITILNWACVIAAHLLRMRCQQTMSNWNVGNQKKTAKHYVTPKQTTKLSNPSLPTMFPHIQ